MSGVEQPCTMICRSPRWLLHDTNVWGKVDIGYIYFTRFAELMVRKPGAGVASNLLAMFLSPLVRTFAAGDGAGERPDHILSRACHVILMVFVQGWLISKLTEAYYKKEIPMEEHGMSPEYGLSKSLSSCLIGMLPERFYDKVKEGSVVIKRSAKSFTFRDDGLVLDDDGGGGGERVVQADLVILATGFRGDEKLRRMFASRRVRDIVAGSPETAAPLYRECVHPRVPQMAVIGYSESATNIHTCEMLAKWVARLLDGAFRLPPVRRMEESVAEWGRYMRRSAGEEHFRRSCLAGVGIWYSDELCRDMGCDTRRKKGLLAEWFQPYGAVDYADIQ